MAFLDSSGEFLLHVWGPLDPLTTSNQSRGEIAGYNRGFKKKNVTHVYKAPFVRCLTAWVGSAAPGGPGGGAGGRVGVRPEEQTPPPSCRTPRDQLCFPRANRPFMFADVNIC